MHPSVIQGTQRAYAKTPSGSPLYQWNERYPDGSVRTFQEVWVITDHPNLGHKIGGIQVVPA